MTSCLRQRQPIAARHVAPPQPLSQLPRQFCKKNPTDSKISNIPFHLYKSLSTKSFLLCLGPCSPWFLYSKAHPWSFYMLELLVSHIIMSRSLESCRKPPKLPDISQFSPWTLFQPYLFHPRSVLSVLGICATVFSSPSVLEPCLVHRSSVLAPFPPFQVALGSYQLKLRDRTNVVHVLCFIFYFI
jgi:hypothetical protein